MRPTTGKKKTPKTVCYRLPDNYVEVLIDRAHADGVSRGEYARRVLIDYLEDGARRRLELELQQLQDQVAHLRSDLAMLAEALLVLASHSASVTPVEACAWVEERLRQAGKRR